MSARFAGKYALISGGSRGIGLAIAKAFAAHGASCCLIGRNREALESAITSLEAASGQSHSLCAMNVGSVDAWDALCKTKDSIDLLVNAAGKIVVTYPLTAHRSGITHYSLLLRTPKSSIEDVMQTNLMGTIYGSKAASRVMLAKRRAGCIINVSSALAHRGGAGSSVYAASKAGVLGFSKALAEELGPRGIRVNAIAPGYIETDMLSGKNRLRLSCSRLTKGMTEHLKAQAAAKASLGRIGTSSEVADAALFLATNTFANGTTLTLDGGLTYP